MRSADPLPRLIRGSVLPLLSVRLFIPTAAIYNSPLSPSIVPHIVPAIQRHSFGIVPIAFEQDGSPVFLILRAYKNWDFPKGGAEEGETPLGAARREMKEETGIQELALVWGEESRDTEIYSNSKVATYYLAQVQKRRITLPASAELGRPEHDEYRWAPYDEARSLLPPRLIPILDWAENRATQKGNN